MWPYQGFNSNYRYPRPNTTNQPDILNDPNLHQNPQFFSMIGNMQVSSPMAMHVSSPMAVGFAPWSTPGHHFGIFQLC